LANNNRSRTVPVGSYGANKFGVHDTVGNVWEWVGDCWHRNYHGAPIDGSAWTSGSDCSKRVLRGGSWYYSPRFLRSAFRFRLNATARSYYHGFRVARTLSRRGEKLSLGSVRKRFKGSDVSLCENIKYLTKYDPTGWIAERDRRGIDCDKILSR
jgi:hypothetical protein